MSDSDYWTMRDIGKVFGTTSHVIGRRLKELGLRTWEGRPSREAFDRGLCEKRWTQNMDNYCWAWHGPKTVQLLREVGVREGDAKGHDPKTCPS
jgi:hypothetical protein